MTVTAFSHHKGGTGKTTTCLQVAGFLVKNGRRVLVIDTDPQANATLGLGIHPDTPAHNIYHYYASQSSPESEPISLSSLIIRTVSGIDLIPSHLDLVGAEPLLYQNPDRYELLTREIPGLKERYDHIFIDTPPFLGQFVLNAIIAADRTVLVFSPDSFALNGYENIRLIITDIEEVLGKDIRIEMAVLNRWGSPRHEYSLFSKISAILGKKEQNMLNQGEDMQRILEEQMKREVGTVIQVPESQQVGVSNRRGMPLAFSYPDDPAAKAFAHIAQELDHGR
ncbi:MAG: AAA family ATPase [Methanospirillum sp.]|nr:AAA family ATPase [Methanospirillum sp.]MDD1728292.1 AAA family ATPase [Methanospirillum sp.]